MSPSILTINSGSSSIKFALFETLHSPQCLLKGSIERIGFSEATFCIQEIDSKKKKSQIVKALSRHEATAILIDWIKKDQRCHSLSAIGHRVVHGGSKYHQPEPITQEMLQELRYLSPFDPEHLPEEILLIETLQHQFPTLLHVACFDTAFHHDLPRVAQLLTTPRHYEKEGLRRYGFHGLSCSFLIEELSRLAGKETAQGRVILAHLGNGSSLTAVHHGKSIDTTMGFSPTSGIMMGTRSGDLDPNLMIFLATKEQLTVSQFQEMVNKKSGILGVSETSSDLRDLLSIEQKDPRAAEAVALFCHQVKKAIGSLAAVLGGLDTLVFTGGIGEHSSLIRKRICHELGFLGIDLDGEQNQRNALLISSKTAPVQVRVIPANEELIIATAVKKINDTQYPLNRSSSKN